MKTNHEKQVAAWEKLLDACNVHGPKYNPGKASMKVTAMKTLLISARESLAAVDIAENQLILAINERQRVFNGLPVLGTRIVNALAATDATPEFVEDANRIRHRFRYPAAGSPQTEASAQDGNANASDKSRGPISQLDHDSKLKNLKALITLVSGEPTYQPNEADLQLSALNQLHADMVIRHKAVALAELALKNARIARNKALFGESGIYGMAKAVKKYALSAFGSTTAEYRLVKGIKFRK